MDTKLGSFLILNSYSINWLAKLLGGIGIAGPIG